MRPLADRSTDGPAGGPKSQIRLYEKKIGITPQFGPSYAGLRGQFRF